MTNFYYHPTHISAVDDDVNLLNSIKHNLDLPSISLYTSPQEAIDKISHDTYSANRVKTRLLKVTSLIDESSSENTNFAVALNLRGLHEEIYHNDRLKDISVIIVDYHMNDINGIELCERLQNHPSKKILLTGSKDKEKVAIEAFNKGIIHQYIDKSNKDFPTQLKHAVNSLQEAYFTSLSKELIPHLPISCTNLLLNPTYINLVRSLRTKTHAIEYYLLDTSGSMLFISENKNPTWLIIKGDSDLDAYAQIANENDASDDLIKDLQRRKKIPFFFSEEDYEQPVSQWNKFMFDCKTISGSQSLYYAVIEGNLNKNIDEKKYII